MLCDIIFFVLKEQIVLLFVDVIIKGNSFFLGICSDWIGWYLKLNFGFCLVGYVMSNL